MLTPNILLIEDSPLQQKMVMAMIHAEGFACCTANDGVQAIDYMQKHTSEVDLILLDLDIPQIDGISALGHFKKNYPHVPVVILSGSEDLDDMTLALAWGAAAFLAKPTTREQLGEVLTRLTSACRAATQQNSGSA